MAIPGLARLRTAKPRRFVLRRVEDVSGVSGVGIVAEGCVFSDETAVLRWTVALRSTAVYANIEELEAIHGHSGATRVEWIDSKDGE